ncbi:MAG: hypothetical protein HPY46_11410 [Candidatus Aminicenantes bacterium]|nr:hypothetical protein [Candidatus Aminicenantes bacterium]
MKIILVDKNKGEPSKYSGGLVREERLARSEQIKLSSLSSMNEASIQGKKITGKQLNYPPFKGTFPGSTGRNHEFKGVSRTSPFKYLIKLRKPETFCPCSVYIFMNL